MKILMVCLGNICRSPLAHGIFQHKIGQMKLSWMVDSAGTGDWHVGHAPDARSVAVARKHGVDISKQRARFFIPEYFDEYDYIFVMDNNNYKDVVHQARKEEDRQKVRMFLPESIVPDPYFDDALFEPVFRMVEKRSEVLIRELLEEEENKSK